MGIDIDKPICETAPTSPTKQVSLKLVLIPDGAKTIQVTWLAPE